MHPQGQQLNRDFYDAYWSGDFQKRQSVWRAWWDEGYAQAFEWAGPLEGRRVLSLFAGHGEDALLFARMGASVVAVDFSTKGLLHLARTRRSPAGRAADPVAVCGDALALPFRAEAFDVVFVINGLVHTEKKPVLDECRRVLAPGGKLLVIEAMRWPHLAVLARVFDPFFWRTKARHVSLGDIARLVEDYSQVRQRQFFFLSVLSVMALRLRPGSRLVGALHRACVRTDRVLLGRLPLLRRFCYLSVVCLQP
jgi:ubiquinone/menaquinone biosynthesis C-methylase UbiE